MAKKAKSVAALADLLATEEKAIQYLKTRRKALEAELDELAAQIATLKGGKGVMAAPKRGRKRRGRGKSLRAAIAEIITDAGEPLRAAEIAEKLPEAGFRTKSNNPRNMVSAVLGQSDDFRRVRKGLYTLKKK